VNRFCAGDLRAALVGVPDHVDVYIDDSLVDTVGKDRDAMLSVVQASLSKPFRLGSSDGPLTQEFVIVVEDGDYAAIGKPVPSPSIGVEPVRPAKIADSFWESVTP
jgi:hypothetical protein